LNSNADSLDKLYEDINKLKGILQTIASKYESPDSDCTGLAGYEKEEEGDGLIAK